MLLKVHNLSKKFKFKRHFYLKSEEKVVFEGVNFSLNLGENLLIFGESGTGKSTLAKIIAMLEMPNTGEIYFEGQKILNLSFKKQRILRQKIAYVFQDQILALNPYKSVFNLICAVYENFAKKVNLDEIKALFESFELDFSLTRLKVNQISSGQAQRIGLIRALLLKPKLLIMDEITAPLDLKTSQKILSFLQQIQRENKISYIFISHQENLMRKFCDKALKLGV